MGSRVHILAIAICSAALATSARAGDPPHFPLPAYFYAPSVGFSEVALSDVDNDGLADLLWPAGDALGLSRGRPDGSFAPIESFAAPEAGKLLTLSDLDGDGDLDAVLDYTQFSFQSAGLQALLNDGDGVFTVSGWTYLGPVGQYDPFVADLNGDDLADIVALHHPTGDSSIVQVFLATSAGQFGPPTDYPLSGSFFFVKGGDLDLDGDVDLALPGNQQIQQLRNVGDGSFIAGPLALLTVNPWLDFRLLDATGDGRLDATCLNSADPIFAVVPGQPDGSFGSEIDVALPYVCESARMAHIDGDVILDLAVSGYPGGTAVLRGLGGLAYEELDHVAFFPYWLDVADVNIDGRPDLVGLTDTVTVALALDGGGFDSPVRLTVDEDLDEVVLADLDGDGRLDLLEKHLLPAGVEVKLQQPDGSFTLVQTLPGSGEQIQTCDLNEDGKVDLLRPYPPQFAAAVALGNGDGTFAAFLPSVHGVGRDVLLADMNNDGHDDLVGVDVALRITWGTGSGTFSGTTSWSTTAPMQQIAAADIDQDGWVDILTSDGMFSSPILKWVNTGSGMMLKSFNPPLVTTGLELEVGDFNGDGDPDLVTLPYNVCLGAPSGQFNAPVSMGTELSTLCRVVDLDADGFDDVVSMETSTQVLHVLRGGPSGLSSNSETYEGGPYQVVTMAIGDVDGDGRLDVVDGSHEEAFLDTDDDFLTIYLQKAPSPFADLGSALGGSKGEPELTAIGTLAGGSPMSLRVTSALPFAPARLIVGAQLLQLPFKGGVLVPLPTLVLPPLPTNSLGQLILSTTWPPALPSGVSLYAQAWITDAAGPAGLAATNGLKLTTP